MRWILKPKPESEKVQALAKSLSVSEGIAYLLVQRGITTYAQAKDFFRPSLAHLHDPFLMRDMDLAVERIQHALRTQQNILVYGDYDVDGTTAVSLMSSYLLTHTLNVATYIPDRYAEGYGVSYQGIDFAADNGFDLIIALDCGIKAIDKVAYAKEKGIDFIICDHHRPGDQIPDAVAVLDPKRDDCDYPYKELCGCGVGFKLIQALGSRLGETFEYWMPYLDLVAIAIGADIVPITGENRVLAYFGLQQVNQDPRPGIAALMKQAEKPKMTVTDLVFTVAPRINAAGRMEHGQYAVTLLTAQDLEEAKEIAQAIEQFNNDRRETDKTITQQALDQITELGEEDRNTTVVYDPQWHKGVIGIVASRLIETYYRPTLVFTKSGDKLAASARSVKGFDVYAALEQCQEHIIQFGGHKYAAGLTLTEAQYPLFKAKFEEIVAQTLPRQLREPEIQIDQSLDLVDISPKFYRILKQFAPFGPGNMAPVFLSEGVYDTGYGRPVGEDEKHLKLTIAQQGSQPMGAIGFGLGDKWPLASEKKPVDIVYCLDENHWQGVTKLQLRLRDLR
jgi:single-stranded-DNA-specific exonuclease